MKREINNGVNPEIPQIMFDPSTGQKQVGGVIKNNEPVLQEKIVQGLFSSGTIFYVEDGGDPRLNAIIVPMRIEESLIHSALANDLRKARVILGKTIEKVFVYIKGHGPIEPSPKHGLVNNSSPAIPPDETPLIGRLR